MHMIFFNSEDFVKNLLGQFPESLRRFLKKVHKAVEDEKYLLKSCERDLKIVRIFKTDILIYE